MKLKIAMCSLVALLGCTLANAQQFIGYSHNNYEAVSGVLSNPASIAGSRYSADIHLFSANVGLGTSAYTFSRKTLFNGGFNDLTKGDDYKLTNNDPLRAWLNVDVLGPSFMFALDNKNAFAVTTRLRTMVYQNNFSRDILKMMEDESDIFNQTITGSDIQTDIHGFASLGVSYARVILDNELYTLKGGITASYLAGLASGSVRSDKLNIDLRDEDHINSLQGDITVAYSDVINDYFDDNGKLFDGMGDNSGFGFDLGAVFELRQPMRSPSGETSKNEIIANPYRNRGDYWLRFAVSVTDIGSIKYKLSPESKSYTVNVQNVDYTAIEPDDNEDLDDYLSRMEALGYFSQKEMVSSYKVNLPTTLRINADWNMINKVYLNLYIAKNLVAGKSYGAKYLDYYMLTPRYETKWVGVSSPLSINGNKEINWGVGFNFGVFYFGSGSMLTNLLKKDLSSADAYIGLHIPIYKKTKKMERFLPSSSEQAPTIK